MDAPNARLPTNHSSRSRVLRGRSPPPNDGSERGLRPQHQHEPVALQPPTKLSLRRVLEQRRAVSTSADDGGVYGEHGATPHSPLPSLRCLHQAAAADLLSFGQAHSQDRAYGGYYAKAAARQYEELHMPPHPQHRAYHSTPVQTTRQSPAPESQANSGTESTPQGIGHSRRRTMTAEERRQARTCAIEGCTNYIVDRHRCFRHGGGKRCSIDGCTSSAKQLGLCWRHGGSILCKVEGCTRGVKVKGLCWGHGGGKKKKQHPTTTKASNLAEESTPHCLFDGCRSPPVLNSFCSTHTREVAQPGYVFEL